MYEMRVCVDDGTGSIHILAILKSYTQKNKVRRSLKFFECSQRISKDLEL